MVPDKWVSIDGSKMIYKVESNDPKQHAGIMLTKVTRISDKETGTYTKKEEYKAEFQNHRSVRQRSHRNIDHG